MKRIQRQTATLIFYLLSSFLLTAQTVVSPLDIPLFLSGNFGELRHNHFHSGIDFKTQGVIGKPVKAVKDGYIYRISVSPYGYGRAVYIDHEDGISSVYGHLDHFSNPIEQAVRDSQYLKESFALNLYFTPDQFPVKQGEVFAYSGNTGSSGGPHVHFEFRETETDKPIDPLPFFKDKIKDTRPPEIRGLMVFPIDGIVNGSLNNQALTLTKDKKSVLQTVTAWGDIGIGIKAYDRMNETSNIYGVYEIILKVDGEEVYHSVMDAFSFDDTRYLNSYIDWSEWIDNNSFYMKSFTDPGNYLGLNRCLSSGVISINEGRIYKIEYVLKDIYNNQSSIRFNIEGKETLIPEVDSKEVLFRYNRDNEYADKGIDLYIPRRNLYVDLSLNIDTVANYTSYAPLYKIGERIPLHSYCPLTLDISQDICSDKTKYGIVQINKNNKKVWLGGEYDGGRMYVEIRELGNFAVMIDDTPPVITPAGEGKWTANKKLSFKITDDLSGILSYKGTLDGEFVLFEYDAKKNSLFCEYDSQRMKKGSQILLLTVTDRVGNVSEYKKTIVF